MVADEKPPESEVHGFIFGSVELQGKLLLVFAPEKALEKVSV